MTNLSQTEKPSTKTPRQIEHKINSGQQTRGPGWREDPRAGRLLSILARVLTVRDRARNMIRRRPSSCRSTRGSQKRFRGTLGERSHFEARIE